ncbi:hypothetical protein [Dokdonia pacifica]|uniref:Uncharacterized protein n=1 Tax=Dokdonia pacifica TaxID=1627892 RepID=A0A238YJU0_9FLAO|nr:hypothetical protein [Dokdonia pacifica]SNR70894.1 hypothetical protein SAMN06265376_10297 [Dokdonia pacifica]
MYDYSIIAEAFLVGAFPWISQLRNLDIHFKIPSFNLKSIFNFFASLFGISIYIILNRLGKYDLLYWPDWKLFILIALLLTIIYMIILIYKRKEVNTGKLKWPILLNFVIYIFIFCNLTSGFGLLETYKDHYVFKGIVVNKQGIGVGKTSILVISDENEINTLTDQEGNFSFLVPKEKADSYNNRYSL